MSDNKKRKSLNFYFKNKSYQLMVFKYLFSIVISFLVLKTTHEWSFVLFNLLELAIIFSISNILLKNHKIILITLFAETPFSIVTGRTLYNRGGIIC